MKNSQLSNFKGFDDWVDIFQGGRQTDSNGVSHDGDALIDRAVSSFDAGAHEPPVVVGHPKDNAPAFGWVSGVRKMARGGKSLLQASFRQVVPEFEGAVSQGLYKKRSASFYPDGRLRHVGFLGAAPPAVKGLADLKFEEGDDGLTFEFAESWTWRSIGRVFRNLREYLIEKEGMEKADGIVPEWNIEDVADEASKAGQQIEVEPAFQDKFAFSKTPNRGEPTMSSFKDKVKGMLSFMGVDVSKIPEDALPDTAPENFTPQPSGFSEADMEAAKQKAATEAREKAEADFAEKARKERRRQAESDIAEFCTGAFTDGKLLPAWEKMGLKEFMLALDSEKPAEFTDGGDKVTPLTWFKNFLEELPKVVEFKEVATREGDVAGAGATGKLEGLVQEKMKADKDLDYSAAFAEVQSEHPDLVAEYQQELTPPAR